MPEPRILWTTTRKLAVFRSCFSGLQHVYGTYDIRTGKARQVKRSVTERVILNHLRGIEPYGVYLLCGDRTRAVVADFDDDDTYPPLRFIRQAGRLGLHAYLERSKRKGWHVWLFMELPGVSAAKGRLVVKSILDDIGQPATEVFPKQDQLAGTTRYGNFIFLPLWGKLVPEGRTVFVAPEDGLVPYVDQWEFLANIQCVTESQLDDIITINKLDNRSRRRPRPVSPATSGKLRDSYGLPPCAQRMLAEGVTQHQRVACFRLALHVKRAGIPQDIATAALTAWATKNRPKDGKRVNVFNLKRRRLRHKRETKICECIEALKIIKGLQCRGQKREAAIMVDWYTKNLAGKAKYHSAVAIAVFESRPHSRTAKSNCRVTLPCMP